MSVEEQKSELRQQMLIKRAKYLRLSPEDKRQYDAEINNLLWQRIKYGDINVIHCYLPMGSEIDILPLIKKLLHEGKTIITPKTLKKPNLINLQLNSLDDLEDGVFGTKHPRGHHVYEGDYDLIIVPGLAFDSDHYRLGYGGAYYDNFLKHHPNAMKLGIFYPFQKVEKVPVEGHDVRLDEIILKRHLF